MGRNIVCHDYIRMGFHQSYNDQFIQYIDCDI